MKEWNCYTNVDKLLKLRWPTYEPTSFLLVWWFGGNTKHNCHIIISKDYETAEYCALEFITLNKVEFEIDNFGNAVQDELRQDNAFEVLNKPCKFKIHSQGEYLCR